MKNKPVIAVSCGDPAGIGPEVVISALPEAQKHARIIICGERRYIERNTGKFDLPDVNSVPKARDTLSSSPAVLLETPSAGEAFIGIPSEQGGEASIRYVLSALNLVMSHCADALVTAPISKEAVALAGYNYPGHTELLGEKTGGRPVMMLACNHLRFSLVTMHVALRDVPAILSSEEIVRVAATTAEGLTRFFGIDKPRIGVMGLNPHASDGGRFGDEEKRIIEPAVEKIRSRGINVFGPLAPDTVPFRMLENEFDAAVAMYHEQAALPVKTLDFHKGVNITLGLPIIRTSPDHGTAFDIAGKRQASPESMAQAIILAARIARRS